MKLPRMKAHPAGLTITWSGNTQVPSHVPAKTPTNSTTTSPSVQKSGAE